MLKRYSLILLATVWLAALPVIVDGIMGWVLSTTLSSAYIIFIWKFSQIRERCLIITIEAAAKIFATAAFIQHYFPNFLKHSLASESQWFWINYQPIMSYCFLMEIVVIIMGIANSGEFRRILFVCISHMAGHKRTYSHLLCSEKHLCTTTQKTFQAH
jgi:hypothetical protein